MKQAVSVKEVVTQQALPLESAPFGHSLTAQVLRMDAQVKSTQPQFVPGESHRQPQRFTGQSLPLPGGPQAVAGIALGNAPVEMLEGQCADQFL